MAFLATRAPVAKFANIGDTVKGTIVDARQVQTSQYKTNRPEYWENKAITFAPFAADGTPNEPKAQLEVTLETGVPDAQGETERRVFIKNKRQFEALKVALKVARAREGLVIGGSLAMTLTGKERGEGSEDANTWAIDYQRPAPGVQTADVSEEVHLVGGGVWRRGQASAAPVPAPAAPPAEADPGLAQRTNDAIAQLNRAQASSPLAERLGLRRPAADEEPPF